MDERSAMRRQGGPGDTTHRALRKGGHESGLWPRYHLRSSTCTCGYEWRSRGLGRALCNFVLQTPMWLLQAISAVAGFALYYLLRRLF